MRMSKALKKYMPRYDSDNWISEFLHSVRGWYYRAIYDRIYHAKKVYAYHKVLKEDYDFDSHGIYLLLHLKCSRLEDAMINGHAIHEKRDLQAIRLIVKLSGKLCKDRYEDEFADKHDAKWGQLDTWFERMEDKEGYSTMHFRRPNANTEEEKEQEVTERRAYYVASQKKRDRDKRNLFKILNNHIDQFWD